MSIFTQKHYRSFCFIICLMVLFVTSNCFAREGEFELNCPYWNMFFDRAGYMDITYYYPTPRHQVDYRHEMCTGDWAAAVWYNGIDTGSNAAWLTDEFVIPNMTALISAEFFPLFYTGSFS